MSGTVLLSAGAGSAPSPPQGVAGRLIREKPLGAFGGAAFLLFLVCGVFAELIAPYGLNETNMAARLLPPSGDHLFGTDHLGRDVLSRVLIGAQLSMIVGACVAALATVVSIVLGVASGYFGGKTDMLIQRFVDAWMIFPDLLLLIAVISVVGPGMTEIIVVLGLLYGIAGSRIVRGAVIAIRENAHTHAARSMGATALHIQPTEYASFLSMMTTLNHGPGYLMGSGHVNPTTTLRKSFKTGQTWNPSRFSDPEVDRRIDEIHRTREEAERIRMIRELTAEMLDRAPYL